MNMLERLDNFIQEHQLCDKSERILLTVSGGKDSMLMADLFVRAGYKVIIAHCNFKLRAEESDLDEALVRSYAEAHMIPFFVKHFDTEGYALEQHISIQMAARALRYQWFDTLVVEQNCQKIAIAHHLNDNIETVFLNLSRGTGLQGLQGIAPKRAHFIRPLLFLTATEISAYVRQNKISYRDDSSNFSTKYARNKIRIDIIPQFKTIQPEFDHIFAQNIQNFRDSYQLLQQFIEPLRKAIFQPQAEYTVVQKSALRPHIDNLPLLYELFSGYNFQQNVLKDLIDAWDKDSGRIFESTTHTLLLDRTALFIRELTVAKPASVNISLDTAQLKWNGYCFKMQISTDANWSRQQQIAQIDFDKLIFPLTVRTWQEGDVFVPLGMRGKKKLSDFFINQKVNIFEKNNIPIIQNGNGDIVWIANWRMDNRYKITEKTKKVFTLVCQ